MMDDRELLELAAKAAGYQVAYGNEWWDTHELQVHGVGWRPLTDDGDALRLAVKLDFHVKVINGLAGWTVVDAWVRGLPMESREPHKGDPYAATRRAIVRAAAEIGKQMESK